MSESVPSSALLVIDVQESFVHRPYFRAEDMHPYLEEQNTLVRGCLGLGAPVVRVLHVEPEGAFSLASGLVRPLTGLSAFEPAVTVYKHRHSAFAGTDLTAWLVSRGIRQVIVSGIRTEQCCETTARAGSDAGFEVDYVSAATLTFPMTRAGRTYSPAELRERTELVLESRFATICSVASALDRVAAVGMPRSS